MYDVILNCTGWCLCCFYKLKCSISTLCYVVCSLVCSILIKLNKLYEKCTCNKNLMLGFAILALPDLSIIVRKG